MRLSEHFGLSNLQQKDLDFVNVNLNKDNKLFIDPAQIEVRNGEWFKTSAHIVNDFFSTILNLYKSGQENEAKLLFNHAHEPNETKLGLSRGKPNGKGSSPEKLIEIFDQVKEQKLIEDGLINNYEDFTIFVEDFAEDRMSDLVTNLLRQQLAIYTVEQCEKLGLILTDVPVNIGVCWDPYEHKWVKVHTRALVVDGKLVLLVPKSIIVKKYMYSVDKYLSNTIFKWRQDYHLKTDSRLVTKKFIKRHEKIVSYPPSMDTLRKKEIKEMDLKSKTYAIKMTKEKLDLIKRFKESVKNALLGTNNNSLTDDEINNLIDDDKK
ncbi:hypothetical protein [Priestia koreensis]|uniref:Uncharacterized protein n=1 Tax=Priestia koreensis TaxID=284581 RepID=A0A0M0KYP3_9BACI|nr:hypothetical protein [Priestia koreensis]KOO43757.1 hypothetical protein AMD01_15485 [Priestia koreensis]